MTSAVFPGQGSQKPGMGKELFETYDASRRVYETVSEAIQLDVAAICFDLDEDSLRQTQNAQIALFTTSMAAFAAFISEAPDEKPCALAGHSIGEFAALACAEIAPLRDVSRMVRKRGELMSEAGRTRDGAMAAVLGMELGALEEACKQASADGAVAVVANDNCPGQVVISGDKLAVGRACALAVERGAKRALPLNVSGAFHSPLMIDAAAEFGRYLGDFRFSPPGEGVRVYTNLTARPAGEDADWRGILEAHLVSPVRWAETMRNMAQDGVGAFVECGSGEVLGGLVRRTVPEAATLSVSDRASLEKSAAALRADPTSVA